MKVISFVISFGLAIMFMISELVYFFQMSDDEMGGSGDEDSYYQDYYSEGHDPDVEALDKTLHDPEHFEYCCLTDTEVERFLNERVEELSTNIQVIF